MINTYLALVVFILGAAIILRGNKAKNKYFVIVAVLALFVVLGFRDAYIIGGDSTSSYLHEFQHKENESWSDVWNSNENHKFFFMLMKLIYVLTNGNYQIYIIVISAFMMYSFGRFILNYSCSPVQSILYYFGLLQYTFMISALKQAMAMAFLLFAFDAMMKKKFVRYLIFIFLASMFHFPSIVFLPAYFIVKIKMGSGYIFFLGAVLTIVYFFRDRIVDIMTDIYDTEMQEHNIGFLGNKAIIMLVIVIAALILRPPTENDTLYVNLLSLTGVAIVIQTFASYNNTFERLADYYFQFSVVLIPLVFENVELEKSYLSKRIQYIGKTLAPYAFCAFGIWRFLNVVSKDGNLSPYKFFF